MLPFKKKYFLQLSFDLICKVLEEKMGVYVRYRLYPKEISEKQNTSIKTKEDASELAIVMQGLIVEKDDFTFRTVKFYQHLFPGAKIIISTWNYSKEESIERLRKMGCEVVLSQDFKPCGKCNVNYQICTSRAGLLKAKELGCKYAIKSRNDFRIYKSFAFDYLKTLQEIFPPETANLKGRIITLSAGLGQLFYTYFIQDFFYFGYTEDLLKLFDIPYSDSGYTSGKYLREKYVSCTGFDLCKEEVPEVYITKRFLEKYEDLKNSVEDSWKMFRRYFLTVDYEELNVIWYKSGPRCITYLNDFTPDGLCPDEDRNISFVNSLMLLSGKIENRQEYENLSKKNIIFK
jgi:hypothetical protein